MEGFLRECDQWILKTKCQYPYYEKIVQVNKKNTNSNRNISKGHIQTAQEKGTKNV